MSERKMTAFILNSSSQALKKTFSFINHCIFKVLMPCKINFSRSSGREKCAAFLRIMSLSLHLLVFDLNNQSTQSAKPLNAEFMQAIDNLAPLSPCIININRLDYRKLLRSLKL